MPKKFEIDEDECISCGTCAELCPGCFKYEEGLGPAEVISFDCPEAEVQEAVDSCPAQCIHWLKD
jgi:ferredoxin